MLMHHVETNYEDVDPDRGMQPVATLQPNETPKPAHTHQWWYIWILLVTLPAKWALGQPIDLLKLHHLGHRMSQLTRREARLALALRAFLLLRYYALPLYLHPKVLTAASIFASHAAGGVYLGLNFLISHVFEGVASLNVRL